MLDAFIRLLQHGFRDSRHRHTVVVSVGSACLLQALRDLRLLPDVAGKRDLALLEEQCGHKIVTFNTSGVQPGVVEVEYLLEDRFRNGGART